MASPQDIGTTLPGGYVNSYGGPTDAYYSRRDGTAYADVAEAAVAVPVAARKFRTVNIAGSEYWWLPADTTVNGLVPKAGGSSAYILPTASSTVKGGIKVGAGLSIATDGTLSASGSDVTKAYVDAELAKKAALNHTHTASQVTDFNSAVDGRITLQKGQPNGLASLDGTGKVPSAQLPAYVDDVLEFSTLSAFPPTGESGKIYLAQDTNVTYRWSGTNYIKIGGGTTGGVDSWAGRTGNVIPVKSDIGLGNVDNTSDANKPISSATQSALNQKEPTISGNGLANYYYGGDKQFHLLPTTGGSGGGSVTFTEAFYVVPSTGAQTINLPAAASYVDLNVIDQTTGLALPIPELDKNQNALVTRSGDSLLIAAGAGIEAGNIITYQVVTGATGASTGGGDTIVSTTRIGDTYRVTTDKGTFDTSFADFRDYSQLYNKPTIPAGYTDAQVDSRIAAQKGQPNGLAPLNASNQINPVYLPSYVDDVLEYPSRPNFPLTGESGKLYLAADTNLQYRWTGTQYVQITSGGVVVEQTLASDSSTSVPSVHAVKVAVDAKEPVITPGTNGQYWRGDKVWVNFPAYTYIDPSIATFTVQKIDFYSPALFHDTLGIVAQLTANAGNVYNWNAYDALYLDVTGPLSGRYVRFAKGDMTLYGNNTTPARYMMPKPGVSAERVGLTTTSEGKPAWYDTQLGTTTPFLLEGDASAGGVRDPYSQTVLTGSFMDSVIALSYDDNGDAPTAPTGSYPGLQFDAILGGESFHYYCSRGSYTPGVTSGAGPVWHRIYKIQP